MTHPKLISGPKFREEFHPPGTSHSFPAPAINPKKQDPIGREQQRRLRSSIISGTPIVAGFPVKGGIVRAGGTAGGERRDSATINRTRKRHVPECSRGVVSLAATVDGSARIPAKRTIKRSGAERGRGRGDWPGLRGRKRRQRGCCCLSLVYGRPIAASYLRRTIHQPTGENNLCSRPRLSSYECHNLREPHDLSSMPPREPWTPASAVTSCSK